MSRDKSQKPSKFFFGEKEVEGVSTIRKTVNHDAENPGFVPVLEPYCDKDSNLEPELANCRAVYDVAKYTKRGACVTIKPPYIQIRLLTSKENEFLKQVAYTLNKLKTQA